MQPEPQLKPLGLLLLHNVSKKNNVGNIIRSACAFGLSKVVYVALRPESQKVKLLKEFNMFGNQTPTRALTSSPSPVWRI